MTRTTLSEAEPKDVPASSTASILAILTCAGRGTRMSTYPMPKHLLPITTDESANPQSGNLWRQIRLLASLGISPIVVHNHCPTTTRICNSAGVRHVPAEPNGESWAVWKAKRKFQTPNTSHVLIWSGDNVLPSRSVIEFIQSGIIARNAVAFYKDTAKSDLTYLSIGHDTGYVTALKSGDDSTRRIKLGLYMFNPHVLASAQETMETDEAGEWSMNVVINRAIQTGAQLTAIELRDCFHDIGTPDGYRGAAACEVCRTC